MAANTTPPVRARKPLQPGDFVVMFASTAPFAARGSGIIESIAGGVAQVAVDVDEFPHGEFSGRRKTPFIKSYPTYRLMLWAEYTGHEPKPPHHNDAHWNSVQPILALTPITARVKTLDFAAWLNRNEPATAA